MAKYNWPQLIEEHAQSGLSQTAFCKANNLNPKYFNLKRSRHLSAQESSSRFVSAQMVASAPEGITLHYGGVMLVLNGAPPEYVASLVRALA